VDVQPCDCQPDGSDVPVLEVAGAEVEDEAVATLVDSKSRRRQEPPHACVPSPGQATA
jgi:hypothetical protein